MQTISVLRAFLHLFWHSVRGLFVFVRVYGLWLGGACFVAGEPGGGASTLSWADAPPRGRGSADGVGAGKGHVCMRRAAVGCGYAAQSDSQMECGGGRPFEPPTYLRSNSTNSSTVKPASLMSFLRVPLSSSLCFGTESVTTRPDFTIMT